MLCAIRRNVIAALAAGSLLIGVAHAFESPKPPKLKAAAQVPNSASPHIEINHIFTMTMADLAGLDPKQPTLSADGIHSGTLGTAPTVQKLGSTECLFAETVVQEANSLDAHAAAQYCANTTTDSRKYDAVLTSPENGRGTSMQEALVHIVVWSKGQWSGTWYRYERNLKLGRGILLPLGSANALTSPPTRLLGKGGLGFLAIHFNIDDSCGIGYDVSSKHTRPLNRQDVIDLISLAEGYATKGKTAAKGGPPIAASPGVGVWGGQLLIPTGPLPATITFTPSLKQGAKVNAISLAKAENGEPPAWQVENSCNASPKPVAGSANKILSIDGTTDADRLSANSELSQQAQRASWMRSDSLPFYRTVSISNVERLLPAQVFLEDQSRSGGGTGGQSGGENGPAQTNGEQNNGAQNNGAQNNGAQNNGAQNNGAQDNSAQNPKNNQSSNPLASGALSIPDEGLYWWDVSVALPVTSFNQLKFDSVNNTLVVKNTNDIKPYALFDTYLGKADLSLQNAISKPFFAAGLPMAGKPLQKSFFGGGFSIALKSFRVQAIAGVRVQKELRNSLAAGASATPAQVLANQFSEWHAKLQVMVGFSVGDAVKVLGITPKK